VELVTIRKVEWQGVVVVVLVLRGYLSVTTQAKHTTVLAATMLQYRQYLARAT